MCGASASKLQRGSKSELDRRLAQACKQAHEMSNGFGVCLQGAGPLLIRFLVFRVRRTFFVT